LGEGVLHYRIVYETVQEQLGKLMGDFEEDKHEFEDTEGER